MCWNLFRIKDYRNGKLETGAIFILPAYLESIQALVVPIVDWTKGNIRKVFTKTWVSGMKESCWWLFQGPNSTRNSNSTQKEWEREQSR